MNVSHVIAQPQVIVHTVMNAVNVIAKVQMMHSTRNACLVVQENAPMVTRHIIITTVVQHVFLT